MKMRIALLLVALYIVMRTQQTTNLTVDDAAPQAAADLQAQTMPREYDGVLKALGAI